MRPSWISAANSTCGAPNPRNAPFGGVFVRVARARIRTFGQRYGPPAWIAPRLRTTGVSVQYAPPSITTSMSWATSVPSAFTPVRWVTIGRVALRRRGEVLVAVVDHPDRLAGLAGEERRVEGDDRGVLLLAAEPAARLGLDDPRLFVVQAERPLQRLVDVVRALERAVDRDAAVLARDRDHRVVLDVELLLVADPVLALEDRGPPSAKPAVEVARRDLVVGEDVVARERVEDRRRGASSGS